MNRRTFNASAASTAGLLLSGAAAAVERTFSLKLNYLLGSCLYGYQYIGEILPEVHKSGAAAIDIWPKVHGDQREQLDDLGEEKFAQMLKQHDVTLACISQFKLGPFNLQDEMRLAQRLGCTTIVTSASGPANLKGEDSKRAVADFVEKMKPHLAVAETTDVTIAVENHANTLIETPDSMKCLRELAPGKHLAAGFFTLSSAAGCAVARGTHRRVGRRDSSFLRLAVWPRLYEEAAEGRRIAANAWPWFTRFRAAIIRLGKNSV